MPRLELNSDENIRLLARERLVRIAFRDGSSSYVIPLGYVWVNGALYGVTEAGRKLELAEANPNVAFQVDTAIHTGLWQWESVTGMGQFRIADAQERVQALAALQSVIAEAPDWWRREQAPHMAAGKLLVWKLTPTSTTGCRYVPPQTLSE